MKTARSAIVSATFTDCSTTTIVRDRSSDAMSEVMRAVPEMVARLDSRLPVENMKTLEQEIRENVFLDRMIGTLSAAFAALATALAAIGLYGVLAYTVAQRTREIGVRMALGAGGRRVRRMILTQVGRIALVGCVLGGIGAYYLGNTAEALLFEVQGRDPWVLAGVAVLLSAVALAAGAVLSGVVFYDVFFGHAETVQALLGTGKVKPETLSTALGAATQAGRKDIAEMLRKAGAAAPDPAAGLAPTEIEVVPFTVRPKKGVPARAKIALLIPTFSYLAYGGTGTSAFRPLSLYSRHSDGSGVCYASRHRPANNLRPSGRLWNFGVDMFLIEWLEQTGLGYDVITDEQLHEEGLEALRPYNVVVTGSHPEYDSVEMLDALDAYLRQGGRFMVRIEDTDQARSSEESARGILEDLQHVVLPDRDAQ